MLLALSISLWALVIGIRLVHLQVLGSDFFEKQGTRQSERTIKLDPRRGPILDREGRALAVSVDVQSLYAVPQDVADAEATAGVLARALGLDAEGRRDLVTQLQKDRAFVWIKRKVDPTTARRVRELKLDGVGFLTEHRRYYPKRELAAHVLGWAGLDNTGMSGIEYAYENQIAGRGAKVVVHTDARRRPVGHTERPSTEGNTVVLSLDERIQHIAERELERAVEQTRSIAGSVVVVEPFSGDVLAMAGRPTFNPNRYSAYSASRWRNRMVSDVFEPGSIFKIVTAAAAIQEDVVAPEEILDCGNGQIRIASTVINDHKAFHELSFRQVMARSSDIGMIRVAQRLGRDNFYRYVRGFGFGEPTGVDLPGESGGLLKPTSRWSGLSLPSMSFGQEVGVTPLQMAMAGAAVANGGYLMKPLIVKRVEDSDGNLVKEMKPVIVRRVLEPDAVDTLREMLELVVPKRHRSTSCSPGLRGGGQDRHGTEGGSHHRRLLDGGPRGFLRGLRPVVPSGPGDPGFPGHAEGPHEPGRRRGGTPLRPGGSPLPPGSGRAPRRQRPGAPGRGPPSPDPGAGGLPARRRLLPGRFGPRSSSSPASCRTCWAGPPGKRPLPRPGRGSW